MTWLMVSLSLLVGAAMGLIYGWYFIIQQERLLMIRTYNSASATKTLTLITCASIARITMLALLWLYILRTTSINFILALISFMLLFWLTVFKKKGRSHERS